MWTDLSQEMRVQILKRVPAKSLLRCRSISKSANDLISSPNFIAAYTEHAVKLYRESAKSITPVIFPHSRDSIFPVHSDNIDGTFHRSRYLKFPNPTLPVRIVCSCNGLLFCVSKSKDHEILVLWNPSIRKYGGFHFPASKGSGSGGVDVKFLVGFGYDQENHNYKVLRFGYRDHWSEDGSYRPETESSDVFDLSTCDWRPIRVAFPAYYFEPAYSSSVHFNGSLCWVGYDPGNPDRVPDRILFSFRVSDETFWVSDAPDMEFPPAITVTSSVDLAESSYLMIAPGGVLAMAQIKMQRIGDKFEDKSCSIWAAEVAGDDFNWTKLWDFDLSEMGLGRPIHLRNNGDTIMTKKGLVVSYNDARVVKCDRLRTLFYPKACHVCPYMECLALLDSETEDEVLAWRESSAMDP